MTNLDKTNFEKEMATTPPPPPQLWNMMASKCLLREKKQGNNKASEPAFGLFFMA